DSRIPDWHGLTLDNCGRRGSKFPYLSIETNCPSKGRFFFVIGHWQEWAMRIRAAARSPIRCCLGAIQGKLERRPTRGSSLYLTHMQKMGYILTGSTARPM